MASVFKRGGKGNRHGYYYVSWVDHTGRRRSKCARTTDKATAERIAAKLENEAAKRREGLIDVDAEKFAFESKRPIAELIAEFRSKLESANRSANYIDTTIKYIEKAFADREITTIADLTATKCEQYVASLRSAGKSARTLHATLTAIKGFSKWMMETGKIARDPLTSVKRPNPESSRRRRRRMLLPDEWPYLSKTTQNGPTRYGMAGAERVLLYRLAIQTGLRAGELRTLTRASVVLACIQPHVLVASENTKNGKAAQLFIDSKLAEDLKDWIRTKTPVASLFNLPHESNLARMLRADLAAARKEWLNASNKNPEERARREQSDFLLVGNHKGESLDFHSLRHTCGAWLALSGSHPKVVQSIMRHCSITLTMDQYGHLLPNQESDSAKQLATMFQGPDEVSDEPNTLKMTGTDVDFSKGAQRLAQCAKRGEAMQLAAKSPQNGTVGRACLSPSKQRT